MAATVTATVRSGKIAIQRFIESPPCEAGHAANLAKTSWSRCVALAAPLEWEEQSAGGAAVDTGAVVAHGQGHVTIHSFDLNVDIAVGAFARVLLGVVEQVLHDVMDGIAIERDGG